MSSLLVCRDVPEGELILVSHRERAVVALAYLPDNYFPEMTFLDARTFDILPTPSYLMPLPHPPLAVTPLEDPMISRLAA